MNIFNRFFLWLVLVPSSLYEKMGINVNQLRAVLNTKLLIDDRRPNTFHQTQQKKQKKPVAFATLGTMFVTGFMGCFFLVSFIVGQDMVTRLTIYFSFFIFILASTLIADFTSVLIDIRDNVVILPKPISDKTFVLARLLHILIHISKLVIPMVLPALIYLGIKQSIIKLFPFIFLIALATLFTIFLINALYIFILKITTPERFKVVISYFQIFFTIAFYASYQLVPRLIDKAALEQYDIRTNIWAWLAPPYWFAGSWELLTNFQFSIPLFVSLLLSVLVPLASIWLVIKYFAPSFNQKLSMISGSGSESTPANQSNNTPTIIKKNSNYTTLFTNFFTEKGAEKMSFQLIWKLTSRSREFKMKVYPSFGYLAVYLAMILLGNKNISLRDIQNQSGSGKVIFISLIYISSLILVMALAQILFSEKYKAGWLYFTTPIETPGRIISGGVKAMLAKFYLPIVTIICITAIAIVGPSIIPNLLLGIFNQLLITCSIAYITIRELPFTVAPMQGKTNIIRGLVSMLIPISFALLHWLIYSFMPVVIILAILSGIASWLVMDAIKHKKWNDLKASYQD
jgi:hypothetical protein